MDELTLLKHLGFEEDPFASTNADQEERLQDYFVPPPYFGTIKGDPDRPVSTVVLAPRGGGKSAQRRMLEVYARDKNIFAVKYDEFFLLDDRKDLNNISMTFHLRNIVFLSLLTLFDHLGDNPRLVAPLSQDDRQYLWGLARHYLEGTQPSNVQHNMQALFTFSDRAKRLWNKLATGPVGDLLSALATNLGITLTLTPAELPEVTDSPRLQVERLFSIVKRTGFRSILILVDKVDETDLTAKDPSAAYALIRPLIRDLTFINSNDFGVKFFLWDAMERYYREDARSDRVDEFHLQWHYEELVEMLQKRLKTYSGGKVRNLNQIFEPQSRIDYEQIVIAFSNYSPRNVLRILKLTMAEHVRGRKQPPLDLGSLNRGIREFSARYAHETYGADTVNVLQRVRGLGFTSKRLASDVLKISQAAANRRIQLWEKGGVIRRISELPTSKGSPGRRSSYYIVQDNALIPLLMQGMSVEELVHNYLVRCSDPTCGRFVFVDISDFENVVPQCPNCQSPLF